MWPRKAESEISGNEIIGTLMNASAMKTNDYSAGFIISPRELQTHARLKCSAVQIINHW